MIHVWKLIAVCGLAATLFFTGCSSDRLASISGTVTYHGKPVGKGTITFLVPNGNGPTAAAIIQNGKYVVKVVPGRKQVKIDGFKIIGWQHVFPKDPSSPMVDIQEQIVPERYNAKSQLTRDITPNVREYDFALEK